jgi:GDP-L-fucose synthase
MKKVLLTGGSGFLGKHLQQYFSSNNIDCTVLNSKQHNLAVQSSLKEIPVANYDHIFHLAAWTQAGTFCDTHRGVQWVVNQHINTNILEWWQQHAPNAKMITFGTSVSYASENNLVEDVYMEGQPYDKFYAYAMCKRMLLSGLQCLNKQYGMNYLYLIPSTLYGPGYHTDDRQPHFIYDLVRKILRAKIHAEPVVLWGDGEQRRELIYVQDFIKIMMTLNSKTQNDIFNIGGGMDYSIKDFAKSICEIVGYDFNAITYDTTQYVGAKSKILDVVKYKNILQGEVGATSLKDGLQETINWFYDHKERFLSK